MIHSSISKSLVIKDVLTSGYAGNLAKGQLAFIKDKAKKGLGAEIVSDFKGMNKKERISIRVGEMTTPANLRIKEVASKSTGFFSLDSILDITSHVPSQVSLKVDHLEAGYDGINDSTALYIPEGKSACLDIVIYGEVASTFFGATEFIISKEVYRAVGETMQEAIRRAVKELKEEKVPTVNGFASITDELAQFLEIGIIDSSNDALAGTNWTFSSINVTDAGESNDLAVIQAQYPTYKVKRTAREEGISTYTILHLASATIADADIVDVSVKNKGCANCPAGYADLVGGVVYSVALEDDGVSQVALVDDLPGYVSGTVEKVGNDGGTGTYLVVVDNELTSAEIASFIATNAISGTAVITKLGTVEDACKKSATTSYTWVAGESCKATTKQFSLVLPDTECGASRLTELQSKYPDLVIEEGKPTGNATQSVTVSTDGVALDIIVEGITYTTADAGTTTQTAAAFVVAHAASILTATGTVVTNPSTNVILFTDSTIGFPVITSASQTVGAIDYVTTAAAGGCKRTYSTYTNTNLVCEECSDIFLQPFYAEAPDTFEGIAWEEFIPAFDEDAKMGIFVKGKEFYIQPEAFEEDFVPYVQTSLKIRSMSFGAKGSLTLNYDGNAYDPDTEFARVNRVQYAQDVNNNAVALFGAENLGQMFFTNKTTYKKNLFTRANLSKDRLLEYGKKYVQYAIKYKDDQLSQGGGGRSDVTHEFRMIVEYGKHLDLQGVLNNLAGKLGLEPVKVLY
jgi:hypothetical protein